MRHRKITIYFTDGTDRTMVIDDVNGVRYDRDDLGQVAVVKFGRTDGTRWREFTAIPLHSIKCWDSHA